MRQLTPLHVRDKYFDPIEKEIQRVFNILIYQKLVKLLREMVPIELLNTDSDLLRAIRLGQVWYHDGAFSGRFTGKISQDLRRLGATYHKQTSSFVLPLEKLPVDVRFAQAEADDRLDKIRKEMIDTLNNIDIDTVSQLSDADRQYSRTVEWIDQDFKKAAQSLTIVPTLTAAQREIISKEWGQNLDLYIKGWAGENILKLREQVEQNAFSGRRAEGLAKIIETNYGTSKSKAKFLARQETALLMSKFQETRYADIGITKYRWSTSHDERVRPDHAALNGKIFDFSQPPVTNKKTGAHNNPGEDFNCRCIAVPIVQ